LALDASQVINILSALSSIAVTASAFFIILQLRQNSKVIRATLHQEKSNISFSMLEQITDESFARRRYQMHEAVKKYGALNWAGFDDSLADLRAARRPPRRTLQCAHKRVGEVRVASQRDGEVHEPEGCGKDQHLKTYGKSAVGPYSSLLL
jgi:hypothetical protein